MSNKISKQDLSKIGSLYKEIELLKKKIDGADTLRPEITADSVMGSSKHFPYQKRVFAVTGINYKSHDLRVKRLKNQLKRRIDKLVDTVAEINAYIAAIPDSEIRMILQCKYVDRLTWDEIEDELRMNKRTAQIKLQKWWNEK